MKTNTGKRIERRMWILVASGIFFAAAYESTAIAASFSDPFGVLENMHDVKDSPFEGAFGDNFPMNCEDPDPDRNLSLIAAVSRALCVNPATRRAWFEAVKRSADIGTAKAAYLPTLSVSLDGRRDDTMTTVNTSLVPGFHETTKYATQSAILSWKLFDFGERAASVEAAHQAFVAAHARHEVAVQEQIFNISKDYYDAVLARSNLSSIIRQEKEAGAIMDAATRRVKGGVAPISDALQAQTSLAEAELSRAKAEGELREKVGILANDMGLAPDYRLRLADLPNDIDSFASEARNVGDLLEQAEVNSPDIVAARADYFQANAKRNQTRAQGLPSVSFSAELNRSSQPQSLSFGDPPIGATVRGFYLGVEIKIPLFEGFARQYQLKSDQAEIDIQRSALDQAKSDKKKAVWASYQEMMTNIESCKMSRRLLETAKQSMVAVQRRYDSGLNGIVELLTAQQKLENAEQEFNSSNANLRISRLKLSQSIGTINIHDTDFDPQPSSN